MARTAPRPAPPVLLRALAALPVVAVAAAVRLFLVGPLGRGIPYLTFFPAVMLATLWAGFPAGFLATLVSALLAFFWVQQGRMSLPEAVAMGIFAASSIGIAALAASGRRHAASARQSLADLRAAHAGLQGDIARRERVEAEVRRANALLRESQALARVGGWEVDLVDQTLFWTEETYRILETSPEACPLDLETPYAYCAPAAVPVIAEAMRQAYEDGLAFDLELELVTARQRRIWARVTGRPVREAGRTVKVSGALQDITAWKRLAEQKHRAIFEHSPLGICWTDPEGLIREVNPAYVAMLGYDEAELLGMPIGHFAHPESGEADAGPSDTAGQVPAATRWQRKDGRSIWVNLTIRAVPDAAGRVQFYFATAQDITAMRQAQEDLNRILREKEIILGTANVGISLVVGRRQAWVNPWLCEVLQYPREELEGDSTRKLYRSEEAYDQFGREAYPVLAAGETFESVQELVRKDGQSRFIHYNGKAIDPSDLGRGTLWVLTDVTDQKRMEEDLRVSEQRFRTLFESHSAVMLLIDPQDGAIVEANPAAAGFYGYGQERLRSMNISEINTLHTADLGREIQLAGQSAKRVFRFPHRLASGEVKLVEVRSSTALFQGRELLFSIIQDVTDRVRAEEALQASEQKYSTLFRILPTGVVLVDAGGRIVDANPASLRILGVSRNELLTLSNETPSWQTILPDGTPCPPEDYVTAVAMREGRAMENVERGIIRQDGSTAWILVSATPVPVKGFGVAWVALDITPRRRAEAALAELNRVLEDRVRSSVAELRRKDQMLIIQNRHAAMGEMIGNIAHQWRQPLNALSMLLINLGDAHHYGELDGTRLERALEKGDLLIQKMSSTINDFMDFYQQGKVRAAFSALGQVRAAVALVEASFEDVNIEILIDASEDVILSGYPNEYSQVLLNLLSNAKQSIRDAGRSPGRVEIGLGREEGFGRLTLRDDGCGIAEELLERIFEPYFSTRESGTGIGLYMSKQIIERHMSGALNARNVDGGAEFTVLVPLAGEEP